MNFDEFRHGFAEMAQGVIDYICETENFPKYIVNEDNVNKVMQYLIHKDIGTYTFLLHCLYGVLTYKCHKEKRFCLITKDSLRELYEECGLTFVKHCPFITIKKSKSNPFETEMYIDKKATDEAFMLLVISKYSLFPVEASAKSICEIYDVSLAGAECYKNLLKMFRELNRDILTQEKRIYMIEGKRRLAIEE